MGGGAPRRRRKGPGDLTPFPTVFWLCCPELKTKVGQLEREGWVKKLEERLAGDTAALEAMERSHRRMASERWALLSNEHRQLAQDLNWTAAISGVGIAAIPLDRPGDVKCLHAHLADFLAREEEAVVAGVGAGGEEGAGRREGEWNAVGNWVAQLLEGGDAASAL